MTFVLPEGERLIDLTTCMAPEFCPQYPPSQRCRGCLLSTAYEYIKTLDTTNAAAYALGQSSRPACPNCGYDAATAPPPYDKAFGDDRECECGHPYYRHFDTYEQMRPVGCKYCGCSKWTAPPASAAPRLTYCKFHSMMGSEQDAQHCPDCQPEDTVDG